MQRFLITITEKAAGRKYGELIEDSLWHGIFYNAMRDQLNLPRDPSVAYWNISFRGAARLKKDGLRVGDKFRVEVYE